MKLLDRTILLLTSLAMALLLAGTATLAAPIFAEGHEPRDEETATEDEAAQPVDLSKLTPYRRVGIIAFDELKRSVSGDKKFVPILLGRLANACPNTEFVQIEVELDADTPLQGEVARQLGEENGLDAILTGSFAISIEGGVYPTKTNNTPMGKIDVECRVIDCESGWSRGMVLMIWEKNRMYPQTIRTQREFEGRMMRDGVDDLIQMLLDQGLLHFEADSGASESGEASAEGEGESES